MLAHQKEQAIEIIDGSVDKEEHPTYEFFLSPYYSNGMLFRVAELLENNLVDKLCFCYKDLMGWSTARSQPYWLNMSTNWESWLPTMEHFFGEQWKTQGVYHVIKLFEKPIKIKRSLLVAALCFWSLVTNTSNMKIGPMMPMVLDMFTLFGFSPIDLEVSAALDF